MEEEEALLEDTLSRIKEMKAKEFPIRAVPIINEDTGCIDLLDKLIEENFPVAIVMDDENKFMGILSIKNLLSLLKPRKTELSEILAHMHVLSCITAFDLVKRDLPFVKDEDDIERVAGLMDKYGTIFLPRIKERKGEIKGMIFLKDILHCLKDSWAGACMKED